MNRRIWQSPLGIAIIIHVIILSALGYAVREEAKKQIEFIEVTMEELLSRPQNSQTPEMSKPAGAPASAPAGAPRKADMPQPQTVAAAKPEQAAALPVMASGEIWVPAGGGGSPSGTSDGTGSGGTGSGTGGGGTGDGSGTGGGGHGTGTGHGGRQIPKLLSNPLPPYPREARENEWEGTVRVRVSVSADGEVEDSSLAGSSGYACLDQAALKGVYRWRFSPARDDNGQPVASGVTVPVRFNLTDR